MAAHTTPSRSRKSPKPQISHLMPEFPPGTPPVPASDTGVDAEDLDSIYGQLVKGVGHEFVTDANVDALARRAEQDGHPILATELREWKAPC
ncbi:MAG: hypothetical protein J7598_25080 [Mitsuaria chitosanitabida]|uniref:hypothetical protein n=1 Tax=Roseateles chitosanitabidus TaxID=65048 RepID=UPI001B22847B|nr:hypothetical protein [Roseateles chitosanitabidus]MBO9689890.1 hypothetical protein [Roseateles chitosanitabidus]